MAAACITAFSAISSGMSWEKLGNSPEQLEQKTRMKAFISSQYIEGQVLMIDRFNNVVVNITIHEFEEARKGRKFKIVLLRDAFIEEISMAYSDVQEGRKTGPIQSVRLPRNSRQQGFCCSFVWFRRIWTFQFSNETTVLPDHQDFLRVITVNRSA